ncbi:MAG: ATPase [Oscillospiraceae bacterium]|nr:ATPase [Oscillospiraceae bacterium]
MENNIFFLGGTSPNGFKTRFGDTIFDTDYHTYIIKGGPGTGKSSLMKKLAAAFPDEEKELYYCSSDPDSLDAVVFVKSGIVFVDGTAPHTFDPEFPGAVQQLVDLGSCWNGKLLQKNKPEIISKTADYLRFHNICRRYVTALSSVAEDTAQIGKLSLNDEKLDGFTERFAKKLLPKKQEHDESIILYRQLSALTPKGYVTNVPEGYTIYLLNDNLYYGSEAFLRKFTDIALNKGYDVCVSQITILNGNKFEHIFIPELKLALMSATPVNNLDIAEKQVINFKRFYDKNIIRQRKMRIRFNEGAVKELRDEAVNALVNAKAEHDKLEAYYIKSIDFDKVNSIAAELESELKQVLR